MITSVKVDSVSAEKKEEAIPDNIAFNINFDDIKIDGENVEVDVTYSAIYQANKKEIGRINIKERLFTKEDQNIRKEIETKWKDRSLPTQFAEEIINFLNFDTAGRGTLAAYAIGFPAPLNISRVKVEEKKA